MSMAMDMSVDEIVALLKRTSLPTIVVEGSDDIIIYRKLEERLLEGGVSILPVGGRAKVLDIFNRRAEFSWVKITFIADQDYFVHTGIPGQLNSELLFFTDGYSIENDAYRDGQLKGLLSIDEMQKYYQDLEKFIAWYALAMNRFLSGEDSGISSHPDHVFASYDHLMQLKSGEEYPDDFRAHIRANYSSLTRGKSLLMVLMKHASYKGRSVRHNTKSMLELVAARPGPIISSLFDRVSQKMAAY